MNATDYKKPMRCSWDAYNQITPNLFHCCICRKRVWGKYRHLEKRPTAFGFAPELWAYCLACWKDQEKLASARCDEPLLRRHATYGFAMERTKRKRGAV